MSDSFHTIGRPHWRVDALGKVTGRARFGADLHARGMLHGKVLLCRRPHARIVSIDTSRAKALPGVHAVLTAEDLSHEKLFGVVIANQPVLAFEKVRYFGDAVAMVAADTPAAADTALEEVRVVYEDLPGLFDPEEAMDKDAPAIHGSTNRLVHHPVRKGDVTAGFAGSKVVLERTYRTQHVEHAYIEPEAVLAEATEDGGMRVVGSIQNIFSTRKSLAAVLDLDLARVSVEHAELGGSFGGKDEVMTQMSCRAALLSRATGRPVRIVNSRESSMIESYKRHPYVMHYKVGVDGEGRLTAVEARIIADAGAYASMSPFVTWRSAVQATGPYRCPNVSTDVYAVYTNNVYTGAMRGFGAPQVNFAIESMIDELAESVELDPLEIRRRNFLERGNRTATGQKLEHDVSIRQVVDLAVENVGWREKRDAIRKQNDGAGGGKRRGIGIACSLRGVSLGAEGCDAVGAIVSVQSDGSVIVSAGLTDMGQGVASALSLIAAEVLGVDSKRVKFHRVDTARVPDSGPTVASRSTLMGGNAAKKAAEKVRDVLFEVASEILSLPAECLAARDGRISLEDDSSRGVLFEETVAVAYAQGKPLLGFGWHKAPETTWDKAKGIGDAYFTFVYSANVAEVDVDIETGRVRVLDVTAVHDVGRMISPAMIRSQICGGIAMGLGYGILEQYKLEEGRPRDLNLDAYLIATATDMPEVHAILVENPDRLGPFGAKSVGEPATEIAAAAILNAIAHATGRRIYSLPADLEMVRLGKHLERRGSIREDRA